MRKLIVSFLLFLSISITLNAQLISTDSLRVSKETLANTELNKIDRELSLTDKQKIEVRKLLNQQNTIQSFNKSSENFIDLLSDKQKEIFHQLLENEEKSYKNLKNNSTLKSSQSGQYSLTLDDASGILDARIVISNHPDGAHASSTNYSSYLRESMVAWTYSGQPMYFRTVMKFILDEIPIGSQVVSATLFFYSDPTITSSSSAEGNSQLSGSNAFYIERITEDWDVLTVTWNNQPASTTSERLLIPASTSTTENIQIDLTDMVQNWINSPTSNYGIKMFLQTESYYRSRNYGSMEHSNTAIHPKLIVEYDDLQAIEYSYDAAGNRIAQQVIVLPNNLKSSSITDESRLIEELSKPIECSWENMIITVYPNPTDGDISIKLNEGIFPDGVIYHVFNSYGKSVCNGSILNSNINKIPIAGLPPGVYVLVLQNGNHMKSWKIIKQ